MVNVDIYSENITHATVYPIILIWDGRTFVYTKHIKRDLNIRDELERRLWKEKKDGLFNLLISTFYKR